MHVQASVQSYLNIYNLWHIHIFSKSFTTLTTILKYFIGRKFKAYSLCRYTPLANELSNAKQPRRPFVGAAVVG